MNLPIPPKLDHADRAAQLNHYLHTEIPLAAAMALQVTQADGHQLQLAAPLAPNRNPHGTVFGGSLATLAIACGWTLLFDALQRENLAAALVIQQFRADYLAPATGRFTASAQLPEHWPEFIARLRSRGRARLALDIVLACDDREVLRAHASYAARIETPP